MTTDENVYLIGEDLLDPYGGAFKVTKGLSTKFPDRVLSSPVSEAGIVGVAGGMALRGLRPVVEIMFGDFTTLIADQLINGIAKFRWMFNEQVNIPIVIRTPMGGRRGYGPTHSQTLEKLFLGVPGLRVIAASALDDPGKLLSQAILEDDLPVLFIENKLLYLKPIQSPEDLNDFNVEIVHSKDSYAPSYKLALRDAPAPTITLTAYGYMAEIAREALLQLAYKHEVFCELIVPTQLAPFNEEIYSNSISRTRRLLTIEEGGLTMGWGAEIIARVLEEFGNEQIQAKRVAAKDMPVPASVSMEAEVLPQIEDIIQTALKMV